MFCTTREQEYILSVLHKTKFMRRDQAVRLLSTPNWGRDAEYTARCLNQLRHIRKIKLKSTDVFTIPIMDMEPVDEDMLCAVDVMLDLTASGLFTVSPATPPYKLCFMAGSEKHVGSYAVTVVRPGFEAEVTGLLYGAETLDRTVIFVLSELSQKDSVRTSLPHFFAVRDSGKYRYFRGGD